MPTKPVIPRDQEPPKCPYNNMDKNNRHPDGLTARTCPTHIAHLRWAAALRYDRVKTGEHVRKPRSDRGIHLKPDLRKPTPKCGRRHTDQQERRACERCRARARHVDALHRDEIARGVELCGLVDATEAVRHVTEVLLPSGLLQYQIADLAGLRRDVISKAINGVYSKMTAISAAAILSVQPLTYPTRGINGHINATGTARRLQGLYAQGWMVSYMADLMGLRLSHLWQIVAMTRHFISQRFADNVIRLVDKLGAHDLNQLDQPLDGMAKACLTRARNHGWLTLDAWDGLDINDPHVKPHGHDALPEALDGFLVIDPQKIESALDETEVRAGVRFPIPFTKAELYQFVAEGSAPRHDGTPRHSAAVLKIRSCVGERTIQRIRVELDLCRRLLDDAPPPAAAYLAAQLVLATEELPAAGRLDAARRILDPYPTGGREYFGHLVVLSLIHPPPYGQGWTDAQVAAWFGTTEQHAADMRHAAVLAGRYYYGPRHGSVGSARRIGTELPTAA